MNLAQAIRILNAPCLALIGAGGKTTALFRLARSLNEAGEPVIVTASTHLHIDQIRLADSHWTGTRPEELSALEDNLHGVMLVTGPMDGNRTVGLDNNTISWLRAMCGYHDLPMLIEADGARRRPLKAPAEHEPAIPEFVETVIVVAGMEGLGKPLTDEYVHRPEIFSRLSGLELGETITPEALTRVLTHPAGGLKNIPPGARRVALLNQADTSELQAQAKTLAGKLLPAFQSVVVASLQQSQIYAVHEPVAGIVLAAGESKRFGQPKQLLDWHGKPFVRQVTETALAAGLSPVVVVTGANAEVVGSTIHDLPITIHHNLDWQTGQSSSLQTGLRALSPAIGAAVFLLADQPQVTPTVLRALVDRHSLDLSPVVAPQVQGQRGTPVLFDRVTFQDLASLTGDVGGRAIFSKFPITYLPWHDESLLADIDTPEDYRKLVNGA
ncbi:MAG: putative selenium-dependent hydroxylase accessory protein YqeC [Chloroflexi bacterium]|nr:putative selenium-dependent hydroxylase accessory protein YqeC [Chloroflexota bacterium]